MKERTIIFLIKRTPFNRWVILEALHPSRNGAGRECREPINANAALATIGIPPARAVSGASPSVNQSRNKERHFHFLEEVYQMGSGFSQVHSHQCSLFAPSATLGPKTGSCSISVEKLFICE
jgi:hypothetical protein